MDIAALGKRLCSLYVGILCLIPAISQGCTMSRKIVSPSEASTTNTYLLSKSSYATGIESDSFARLKINDSNKCRLFLTGLECAVVP